MTFTNILFLFYFLPIILILYFLAPRKHRNTALFAGSLVFCAWGEPLCFLAFLFVMLMSYLCTLKIIKLKDTKKRKILYSLTLSLIVLFFLSINIAHRFLSFINSLNYIGFLFVTFRLISFVTDIYKNGYEQKFSFINFGTYVTMFPIMIAGPFTNYSEFETQLTSRIGTIEGFSRGLMRFTVGLFKKVLIADILFTLWLSIKQTPTAELSVASAWLGLVAFGFSVYYSLSGYSDMAIGLGKMFGFQLEENFNYPIMSISVTDFVKRWFISPARWIKQCITDNLKVKLWVRVFIFAMLFGLIHGTGFNFILWGMYLALILTLEKVLSSKTTRKFPKLLKWIYTAFLVTSGWALLANSNVLENFAYIKAMFGISNNTFMSQAFLYDVSSNSITFIVAMLSAFPFGAKLAREYIEKNPMYALVPTFLGIVLCLAYII